MQKLTPLLAIAFLFAPFSSYAADTPAPIVADGDNEPDIGIGGGETDTHTHLSFKGIPQGTRITKVSTHLIVDRTAPTGLNFFAIQVNFPNNTWAHGGLQYWSGKESANWGGLVNRGGGSADYKEADPAKNLLLIESGIGGANTVPYAWDYDKEYVLTVKRIAKVALPAMFYKKYNVELPERKMWVWEFTVTPTDNSHEPFRSIIFNSSSYISSFYLWNEAGYGSTAAQQHALWSIPTYGINGTSGEFTASDFGRF